MGRFIIKLHEYYLEWSTVTDSPVTFGMTLNDFVEYYRAEYGRHGYRDLKMRLERVEKYGSSAHQTQYWLPSLFVGNRAGPNETELTEEEIYHAYCLREPIYGGWMVPTAVEIPLLNLIETLVERELTGARLDKQPEP